MVTVNNPTWEFLFRLESYWGAAAADNPTGVHFFDGQLERGDGEVPRGGDPSTESALHQARDQAAVEVAQGPEAAVGGPRGGVPQPDPLERASVAPLDEAAPPWSDLRRESSGVGGPDCAGPGGPRGASVGDGGVGSLSFGWLSSGPDFFCTHCDHTGTLHLQGVIHFSQPVRYTAVKGLLGVEAHVEAQRGTDQEAIDYVHKPAHTCDHEALRWTYGAPKFSGQRTDWDSLKVLTTGCARPRSEATAQRRLMLRDIRLVYRLVETLRLLRPTRLSPSANSGTSTSL